MVSHSRRPGVVAGLLLSLLMGACVGSTGGPPSILPSAAQSGSPDATGSSSRDAARRPDLPRLAEGRREATSSRGPTAAGGGSGVGSGPGASVGGTDSGDALLPGTSDQGAAQQPAGPVRLGLRAVASGLDSPVFATSPAGDGRLFVVERGGTIRVVGAGGVLPAPFLDISGLTRTDGEYGLLGLAFHPGYASNGRFFVHYSAAGDGSTRVVEYRVSGDPNRADPGSARQLLAVQQPSAGNHKGGMLAFGPDGGLYLGLGDGGGAGDTYGNGQNFSSQLASILRVDIDGGGAQVMAKGLRNPWRFSFDRQDGTLYLGDVGQDNWEEIDVVALSQGLNFGWPIMEGTECYTTCSSDGYVAPVLTYATHDGGTCGVIGGYVYRGGAIPGLAGTYFYSDLCAGFVRSFRYAGGISDQRDWGLALGTVYSFGEDAAGELYVCTDDGTVSRIVAG